MIHKVFGSKNFMERGGGREYHDFLSKFFLSHSAEKSRKRTLLCFTKFLVAERFMDKGEGNVCG